MSHYLVILLFVMPTATQDVQADIPVAAHLTPGIFSVFCDVVGMVCPRGRLRM